MLVTGHRQGAGRARRGLDYLIKYTAVRSNGSATAREAAEASKELLDYLSKLVSCKQQDPADDLISKLVIEQVTLSTQCSWVSAPFAL